MRIIKKIKPVPSMSQLIIQMMKTLFSYIPYGIFRDISHMSITPCHCPCLIKFASLFINVKMKQFALLVNFWKNWHNAILNLVGANEKA